MNRQAAGLSLLVPTLRCEQLDDPFNYPTLSNGGIISTLFGKELGQYSFLRPI